jgi:hypothetical protein
MTLISSQFGRLCFIIPLLIISLSSCNHSIKPIADQSPGYSMYGALNIGESPNFIRVHDNSFLLTPEATRDLNITMFITDLNTNITSQLSDSVVVFDSLYTHNFLYDSQITFNNRYKVLLEDEFGYRDSLISVTPSQTEFTLSTTEVECDQRFYVDLTNIDLNAGEQLIAEAGIELSNTWYWTARESVRDYDSENNILTVGWSPEEVSADIFTGGFGPGPGCDEFSSDFVRFRFTHIGYMEGGKTNSDPLFDPDEGIQIQRKIVLGINSEETEIDILPD